MGYQYVLLDWDGCLAKTLEIVLVSYKIVLAQYKIFPEDKEIAREAFGDWGAAIKFGIKDLNTFNRQFVETLEPKYIYSTLYEGVVETLMELRKRGKKLALITTSMKRTVTPVLLSTHLEKSFDVYLFAEDVTRHKPDPEMLLKAITLLGGKKEETVIIGDSKNDLGAASNAGIDSILFYPPSHKLLYDLKDLQDYNPTYIIEDFRRILDLV